MFDESTMWLAEVVLLGLVIVLVGMLGGKSVTRFLRHMERGLGGTL